MLCVCVWLQLVGVCWYYDSVCVVPDFVLLCRVVVCVCVQAKQMWVFVRREEMVSRLRIVFDCLQLAGLQVLIRSHEQDWFVVRGLVADGIVLAA